MIKHFSPFISDCLLQVLKILYQFWFVRIWKASSMFLDDLKWKLLLFFVSGDAAVKRFYQSYTTFSCISGNIEPTTNLLVRAAFSHSQCANRPFWPLVSKYTIANFIRSRNWLIKKNEISGWDYKLKVKKIREKKITIFICVERPFNINIISCNFLRSLGIGKWDKIGSESSENAKKNAIFQFSNSLSDQ